MLETLVLLSLHRETLVLSKILVPTKRIGRMFSTDFCDTQSMYLFLMVIFFIFEQYWCSLIDEMI